jgi:hypothetical protein
MIVALILTLLLVLTMTVACTSLVLFDWEYNFEGVVQQIKINFKFKDLNILLYWTERKITLMHIMEYSSHYIASVNKEIYSNTNRRKIGNIASQLI